MTVTAFDELRSVVTGAIRDQNLDPNADRRRIAAMIQDEVHRFQTEANLRVGAHRALARPEEMCARLAQSVLEFGPLTEVLEDDDVEEIFVEGSDVYYVDRLGHLVSVEEPASEEEILHQVKKLLQETGRELNERAPLVQARVMDGRARLGVVGRPIADHLSVTLRKYTMRNEALEMLVGFNAITDELAAIVRAAMSVGLGVLVCGRPGAGKTTFINASLRAVPTSARVLVCEEVREISAPINHGSFYQTRSAPGDDPDLTVSLRDIVKMCLGMRPDLMVIGEVRGAEAFELLRAGNAGCGVMATVHGNSCSQALTALVDTAIMAGENVPADHVTSTLSQIFDLVFFLDREDAHLRDHDGPLRRQVMEVAAVPAGLSDNHGFHVDQLLVRERFGAPLEWTGKSFPPDVERKLNMALARQGQTVDGLLSAHAQREHAQ